MADVFAYLEGFGTGGGSNLYYSVVCSTTEPAKKEGRIWVKSGVPMTKLEFGKTWTSAAVGTTVIGGVLGGANPTSANKMLEIFYTKLAGIYNRMKVNPESCKQVQGSVGNWVSVDAYVCHSDTWIQFSSVFSATINITYPAGSTCTCTNGSTTLSAPDTSGTWACIVPNAGTWTVSSTDGDKSKSADAVITTDGQSESVILQYVTYLFKDGETYDSLTGGWQGTVNAEKQALVLSPSAGKTAGVWTKNKIDLTNFSTVSAKTNSNTYIGFSIIIASAVGSTSGQVATAQISGAESELSLDISSITGEYFVWLSAYSENGATRYVYEVSMK